MGNRRSGGDQTWCKSTNRLCGRPASTWRWALSSTCTWLWYGQSWSKVHQVDINRLCSWQVDTQPTVDPCGCRGCRGCRRLTNRRLAGTGRTHTILEVGDQWSRFKNFLEVKMQDITVKLVNLIHNNTWYFMMFNDISWYFRLIIIILMTCVIVYRFASSFRIFFEFKNWTRPVSNRTGM